MPKTWSKFFSSIAPRMEGIWESRMYIYLVTRRTGVIWMPPTQCLSLSFLGGQFPLILWLTACIVLSIILPFSYFQFYYLFSGGRAPENISFGAPPFQWKVQIRCSKFVFLFPSLKRNVIQASVCSVTLNQKTALSGLFSFW